MEGLVAQGLVKWFKSRKVVDNVSLDIQRGEVVGLLGPNGAGKTTSFYMMVGLLPTDGGRIFLEGEEISRRPMYQRCRMGIGYLPQESSVFRKLTVEEDIQEIVGRLRERGIGILITDHNVRETLAITDRAYILYDGRILVSGTATEIATNPVAREIYLGDRFAL